MRLFVFAFFFGCVAAWHPAVAGQREFEGKHVTKFTKEWMTDYHTYEKQVYHAYTKTIKDTDGVEHHVEILHGSMVGYHKNGKKSMEVIYRHGKRDGLFTMWAANGTKTVEATCRDGKIQGKYMQWNSDGRKMYEQMYKDGKVDGETVWWDTEGRLLTKGIYKAGQPWDGTFPANIAEESGRSVIRTYKDGKKIGEERMTAPWWW